MSVRDDLRTSDPTRDKAMDYRTFYISSSSLFLWSYELDLLEDGSVAAQGILSGAREKED